jgi:transcriptional regulator with XRE-family HTH domain
MELARLSGISQSLISAYENGTKQPGGEAIAALAAGLECSTDYLLGLTNDPTPVRGPPGLSDYEAQVVRALREHDPLRAIKLIVSGE